MAFLIDISNVLVLIHFSVCNIYLSVQIKKLCHRGVQLKGVTEHICTILTAKNVSLKSIDHE